MPNLLINNKKNSIQIKSFIEREMGELDDISEEDSGDENAPPKDYQAPPQIKNISIFEHNEIVNNLKEEIQRLKDQQNYDAHIVKLKSDEIDQANSELRSKSSQTQLALKLQ